MLRGESLLSVASRLVQAGHPARAVQFYAELIQDPTLPSSIRDRARLHSAALSGQGNVSDRAEVLANRFLEEISEPSSLFALTVAGAAFRVSRLLTLSRLAASPTASFLSRGLGARAIAGLSAFGVEATVFPLAGRLGSLALGRELDWSREALSRELASSFLMLGALRVGGLISGSLAQRSSWLRPAIQQAGMYGGILLGHELELRAGLRERTSGAITLVDSLSTLLQFNVAARLSRSLMGERFQRWERSVEAQTQAMSQAPLNPPLPSLYQRGIASLELALAGQAPYPNRVREHLGPDRSYMSSQDGGGKGPKDRRATVVSLDDYRRRRNAEHLRSRGSGSPANDGSRSSQEPWRSQLAEAIRSWLPEDLPRAERERQAIEGRLESHAPEIRYLVAYLAAHHRLAAKVLMLRHDLLAPDSVFQRDSLLRIDHKASDFFEAELADIYESLWLRYVNLLRFDEAQFSIYDVPLSSPEFFASIGNAHPALVAALNSSEMPAEVFLPLIQYLGIFPGPRSPE